jgi:pyruvate dehydrogenase (quinone)
MYELDVEIVVFNGGALGMIGPEMMVDGVPDYQIDNGSIDTGPIVRAAVIHFVRVEEPEEVGADLREALAHSGSARVDLVTYPNAAMSR